MSRKALGIILGIVLIIAAAVTYVVVKPTIEPVAKEMGSMKAQKSAIAVDQNKRETTTSPGEYKDYSEEAVSSTDGTKLLFFHASWCPQCREIESSITENGLPNGVTVFKIDYDTNQKLRQKYGVTLQTTFVKIDDSGNKIASYVAYEEPQFSSVERELL